MTRRRAELLAVLAIVLVWFVWLRPPALGGHASFIIVRGESMLPALSGGELVIARRQDEYRIGDVVAYQIPSGDQRGGRVIHRIVGGTGDAGFAMRGDNKVEADPWQPRTGDIIGRTWIVLPAAGRLLLWLRTPAVLAAVAGGYAFALAMTWPSRDEAHSRG